MTDVIKRFSQTRLQLIKAETKRTRLSALVRQYEQDILDFENQIAATQARLEALQEINKVANQQLKEAITEYVKLAKEFDKEKEGTGQVAG